MPDQRFIQVTTSVQDQTATLTVWDQERKVARWVFTNGVVAGDLIRFNYITTHPYFPQGGEPTTVDYIVVLGAGGLVLEGTLTSAPIGADIPYFFGHSNVVAVPPPRLSIDATPGVVEIRWTSLTNLEYQVQWCSGLLTDSWTDLGTPVAGTGRPCRVIDNVPIEASKRFYRVAIRP